MLNGEDSPLNIGERVDLQAADILTLYGKQEHDPVSFALASGLRDNQEAIRYTLTELEPSEIFTQLEDAIDVVTDGGVLPWQTEDTKWLAGQLDHLHAIEAQRNGMDIADDSDQRWNAYHSQFNPPVPQIPEDSEFYIADEGVRDPFAWEE